ncbi:hypothetical protein M446_1832 [Methylobacterium sp. 4-46]|nr:hypothetical protein M446_1832 [Methylobacterium sp. 4-46]
MTASGRIGLGRGLGLAEPGPQRVEGERVRARALLRAAGRDAAPREDGLLRIEPGPRQALAPRRLAGDGEGRARTRRPAGAARARGGRASRGAEDQPHLPIAAGRPPVPATRRSPREKSPAAPSGRRGAVPCHARRAPEGCRTRGDAE